MNVFIQSIYHTFLYMCFSLYLGDNIKADEMNFNIYLEPCSFLSNKLPTFLKGNHTTFAQDLFKLAFPFQNSLKVLTKSKNLYQKGPFILSFSNACFLLFCFFVLLFGFGV